MLSPVQDLSTGRFFRHVLAARRIRKSHLFSADRQRFTRQAELRLSHPRFAHSIAGLRRRRRRRSRCDRGGRRGRRRLHHSGRTLAARAKRPWLASGCSARRLGSADSRPKCVHLRAMLTIAGPGIVATMAGRLAAAGRQAVARRCATGLDVQRPTGRLSDAYAAVALGAARLAPGCRAGQTDHHHQDPSRRSHGKYSYFLPDCRSNVILQPFTGGCPPCAAGRGQVHFFGRSLIRQTRVLAEKWTSPPPAREPSRNSFRTPTGLATMLSARRRNANIDPPIVSLLPVVSPGASVPPAGREEACCGGRIPFPILKFG
jgi:hypothetical protein